MKDARDILDLDAPAMGDRIAAAILGRMLREQLENMGPLPPRMAAALEQLAAIQPKGGQSGAAPDKRCE
jgi:hypothetical protein